MTTEQWRSIRTVGGNLALAIQVGSGIAAVIGGIQAIRDPAGGGLTLLVSGLMAFAVSGVLIIIAQELRLRSLDEIFGNRQARDLWKDGLPAVPQVYLEMVAQGDLGTVRRFWEAGVSIKTRPSDGKTDLHLACENGYIALIDGLLMRGGKPKAFDKVGHSPLMLAVANGHTEVVRALLRHPDPGVQLRSPEGGYSALFIAAWQGHREINCYSPSPRSTARTRIMSRP